eukprot:3458993-Ditylum_brightwellii.AAC.1
MLPTEVLLGHREEISVNDCHSWGRPIFILDSKLQSGQGIGLPKWDPRAQARVYPGHSLVHAGNVALVLNLQSGHVSPQYHMVFDDEFTTVPYINSTKAPPNWSSLVKHHSECATTESYTIASMRYEGEEAHRAAGEQDDEDPAQMREQGHEKMREPQGTGFVDTNNLGLRRSPRIRELNLKSSMADDSEIPDQSIGLLLVALHTTTVIQYQLHQCYQACKENYYEYIDSNFDGTLKSSW